MIEYKNVRIPSTADDWQIYTIEDDEDLDYDSDAAAADLTEAAKKAIDLIGGTKLKDAKSVQHEALEVISKVQRRHYKAGACDSEPNSMARGVIIRAMREFAGIEVDPWSL